MSRYFRALWLAALLPLGACDRAATPGVDQQSYDHDSFADAPRATRVDTNRDSVSGGDDAYTPVGTTSGARSTAEAVSMQPGGDPNTSKYTNSGTTDGTSTTSGRSLTGRGAHDTEGAVRNNTATTSGSLTGSVPGQTTQGGRGTLNTQPRSNQGNARKNTVSGPQAAGTQSGATQN